MRKGKEDLDPKQIGTVPAPTGKMAHNHESRKPDLNRDLQRAINWLDRNVLPTVAIIFLAGLAGQRAIEMIPQLNHDARVVAGILIVSLLVVKSQSGKVK
jgi:hypothetical protein